MAKKITLELTPKEEPKFNKDGVDLNMSEFKITRLINGEVVEIVLTGQEVSAAYDYQEHIYHIDDIIMTLDELEGDDDLSGHTADEIISIEKLMEQIVAGYERNMDKYDMEWHAAAVDAIHNVLSEAEKNGFAIRCLEEVPK